MTGEWIFSIIFRYMFFLRAQYQHGRDTTSGFTDVDTAVARA